MNRVEKKMGTDHEDEDLREAAKFSCNILTEISDLLDTGLDKETLTHCIRLCQNGQDPEGLAKFIKDIKEEAEKYRKREELSKVPKPE